MRDILKPLEELTTHLQKEEYLAGDFMYNVVDCRRALLKLAKEPGNAVPANDLLAKLDTRMKMITKNIQFAAALYMDPRYVHSSMGDAYLTEQDLVEVVVRIHLL